MSLEDALGPANLLFAGSPIGGLLGLGSLFRELAKRGKELFGEGGHPSLPPPPKPNTPATPDGQGPAHEEIDKLNNTLAEIQRQLTEMHKASEQAAGDADLNSHQGRTTHDQILSDGAQLGTGLAPQGSTPEGESGRLTAMQQQLDELTKNVHDKANAANGIADGLRNLGMGGMPGMGMPGLGGGSGLGMPSLGGGGVSPLGGSPFGGGAPSVSPLKGDKDLMTPPDVSAADNPLKPPSMQTPGSPPNNPPATGATPAAAASPTPPPGASPAPAAKPEQAPPQSNDITLPSGQVVTAPNSKAAAAVRNALAHPSGSGDVATTAYAGTGVDIPTDGADPGKKIDPADVKPGDIIVADDHTAIVAGNGQLIGPDGKLQPLGVINDMTGFKGIFRPTETDPAPTQLPPSTQPVPAPTTVLAAPSPTPATSKLSTSPGFGLPPPPAHDS